MHVQASTFTRSHRAPALAAAALASAAIAAGVIAISNDNDSNNPAATPVEPAAVQNATDRVLDGSPLVRGTESTPVLDGSPLLRGAKSMHIAVTRQGGPRFRPFGVVPTDSGLGARRP